MVIGKRRSLYLILILICLSIYPLCVPDYFVSMMLDILMWIALTESWIMFSGYTGYISLGHSAFFGLGAYFMAMTWTRIPFALSVVLAGLICALFAFVIGFPFLRVRGPYFVILTLGLTEFTKYIFINFEMVLGATTGIILMSTPGVHVLYYSVLVVAVIVTITAYLIKSSRFGIGLFSIKENEDAANSLGVNTRLYKWLSFGISAIFPGMIGAILALRRSYIDPYGVFNLMVSFQVIVMAFLGGVENPTGAIIGATVLTLVSEALWAQYPYYYMIILGCGIIALVRYMPMGIYLPFKQMVLRKGQAR